MSQDALFDARTHARPLLVEERDRSTGSRWGGAAPRGLEHERLAYYLTLEGTDIDPGLAGRAISVFAGASEPWTVRAVAHPSRERGEGAVRAPGRGLAVSATTPDPPWIAGTAQGALRSKIGGRPGYLQHELLEQNEVDSLGLAFVFQFVEECLPSGLPLPLVDGAVYVFALPHESLRFDLDTVRAYVQVG
jgi:hypothetical protein